MRIDILTILPKLLDGPFHDSILKRAIDNEKVEVVIHDIRTYTNDKHKKVDDYQYGGGAGMVINSAYCRLYRTFKIISTL